MMRAARALLPALAIAVGASCSGCLRATDSQAAPAAGTPAEAAAVPVTLAPVAVRPAERRLRFVGTLFGEKEVTLSSLVDGRIKVMHVDLGDHVRAGQVLAEVDAQRTEASLREAEARLAKARADQARGRELRAANVLSPQEYEARKTAVAVTEAQRDRLSILLKDALVRSPLDGSIAKRMASAGEFVRPGTPLLELVADRTLVLRGDVPERFAPEIEVGQKVEIEVDAYAGRIFEGRLARVSPAVNREKRSISMEARIDNAKGELKPGFFARAGIITRSNERALMVPQRAVVTFAGVTKLFVADGQVARERLVRTGRRGEDRLIEITEGVRPGELVVTSGFTKLSDGTPIEIRRPAPRSSS